MSNELRLLKAFIEAMGYEVESNMVFFQDENTYYPEKYSHTEYTVKKKQRAKRECKEYSSSFDFERTWEIYPKRAGSNPKKQALAAYLKASDNFLTIHNGVVRYKAFCDATGKTGTEYVMQAAKFFGRDKHYLEPWTLPVGHNKLSLPRLDDQLEAWAIKNGLPRPNLGESYAEYRRRLTDLIGK